MLIPFAALVLLLLASEVASGAGNSIVGQAIVGELRKDLVRKILHAPIDELERVRSHRIIAALTTDINHISEYSRGLSYLVVAFCEALGCAAFLVYTSPLMFVMVSGIGVLIYIFIRHVSNNAYEMYSAERLAIDDLQKHYRALVEGAKELRVNERRRKQFFNEQISSTVDGIRDLTNQRFARLCCRRSLDTSSFFIVAGVLLASTPYFERAVVINFIMVLLFSEVRSANWYCRSQCSTWLLYPLETSRLYQNDFPTRSPIFFLKLKQISNPSTKVSNFAMFPMLLRILAI